ncbi:Cysteine proteinases superfamily protein [Quillaja saponaria]|uniref:Cysteine proteinases superfamily protein n=1 Tax=Quillaja saponaria TaxID=32244 RepID=A0AAD7VL83_QUISA|nr:Cysteine proteinases superfamily protein [Quillaja saponaria]
MDRPITVDRIYESELNALKFCKRRNPKRHQFSMYGEYKTYYPSSNPLHIEEMKVEIKKNGPPVAVIPARIEWQHMNQWIRGIYQARNSKREPRDDENGEEFDVKHVVMITGFGRDGRQFWEVQNSYGPSWGEGGFAKIGINVPKYVVAFNPN